MKLRRTFRLDPHNGKLMGVCAGLANYTGWDVTWIRVGAVLVTLLGGFPWTLLAYGLVAFLAKPRTGGRFEAEESLGGARDELRTTIRDIDRRMAEVEHYVTSPNGRLAQEIDSLR